MVAWRVLILLIGSCLAQRNHPGDTPCPNVARYTWDDKANQWQGLITIVPPVQFSVVNLKIKMTVTYYPFDAGYGRIDIMGGEDELHAITRRVLNNQRQTLRFLVEFPPGKPTPRIAGVNINGKEFCQNNLVYNDVRGSINLEYNMDTGVSYPTAPGDQFQVQSGNGNTGNRPNLASNPSSAPVYGNTGNRPNLASYPSSAPVYGNIVQRPNPATYTTSTRRPVRPTTQRTTTRTTPPWTTQPPTPAYTDSEEYPDNTIDSATCGISSPNQLIFRGEKTEPGEWPWHVAMFHITENGTNFQCGGTLISSRHVLTAAHCVTSRNRRNTLSPNSISILLGRYNLLDTEEDGQVGHVRQIVVHPLYNAKKRLENDIALIILENDVKTTSTVMPACLWEDGDSDLSRIVRKRGTVIGWGKDENGDMAHVLRSATMPVVSQQACKEGDSFFSLYVTETSYCAGYRNGTTVCNGDSGGGMHMKRPNPKRGGQEMWYVRGVVSKGKMKQFDEDDETKENLIDCDDESYVIFTDVAKMTRWIRDTIAADTPKRVASAAPTPTDTRPQQPPVACGRATAARTLILQGTSTSPGQFPWHVALYLDNGRGGEEAYQCGGTLVSRTAVVTAAHCVNDYVDRESAMRVYLGIYDLRRKNENGVQQRGVSHVLPYPGYNTDGYENDIALLILQSPVEYTDLVRPICLWPIEQPSNHRGLKAKDRDGWVAGWGRTETSILSNELLKAKMPIVNDDKCRSSDYSFYGVYLRKSNFCAGYGNGSGVCNGDSGGGLYCTLRQADTRESFYLRGVVSLSGKKPGSENVCDLSKYVLFTNAPTFTKWIRENADLS